jgi:hypothetical protein
MSAVVATAITEQVNKDKPGIGACIQGSIPTSTAADTVSVTVPTRWIGTGFTVLGVRAEKWTTGAAAGARAKTNQLVTVTSIDEATGIVICTLGSGASINTASESARIYLDLAPAS